MISVAARDALKEIKISLVARNAVSCVVEKRSAATGIDRALLARSEHDPSKRGRRPKSDALIPQNTRGCVNHIQTPRARRR